MFRSQSKTKELNLNPSESLMLYRNFFTGVHQTRGATITELVDCSQPAGEAFIYDLFPGLSKS